jgi:hypothetical protein
MIGRRHPEQGWRHRTAVAAVLVTTLTILYAACAAGTGRWWAGFVTHAVNAEPATGAILGFCFGAVFTLVPATLAWVLTRGLMPWTIRAPWLAAAAVLTTPNMMTLGVTLGRTPTAADARRTLDTAAPMFRGATLAGTAAALLTVGAMMIALRIRDAPPTRHHLRTRTH